MIAHWQTIRVAWLQSSHLFYGTERGGTGPASPNNQLHSLASKLCCPTSNISPRRDELFDQFGGVWFGAD